MKSPHPSELDDVRHGTFYRTMVTTLEVLCPLAGDFNMAQARMVCGSNPVFVKEEERNALSRIWFVLCYSTRRLLEPLLLLLEEVCMKVRPMN